MGLCVATGGTTIGGVDLNRDWGKFTQPETQADGRPDLAEDRQLILSSKVAAVPGFSLYTAETWSTLFPRTLETNPAGFTDAWLAEYQLPRCPDYEVVRSNPDTAPVRGVSKNWVYDQYGVPTATFELGDETDRMR